MANIERLHGESDFYVWKSLVTSHLKKYGLWNVISGATPRPATPTPEQESWDSASLDGIAFLYRYIDRAIHRTLPPPETGPGVWAALMRRYHQRDGYVLVDAFKAVSSLRYSETGDETFPAYLDSFQRAWGDLENRTADATTPTPGSGNSLETALHVVAVSEDAKIEFLIGSLPHSMWIIAIDVRNENKTMTFMDLRDLLLRLHASRERKAAQALEEVQKRECSWCRSRGFDSAGHRSGECVKLQEFKLERSAGKKNKKRRQRG